MTHSIIAIAHNIGIIDAALIRYLANIRKDVARLIVIVDSSYYQDLIPIDHIEEFLLSLSMVDGVIHNPNGSNSTESEDNIEFYKDICLYLNNINNYYSDSSSVTILPDKDLRSYGEGRIGGGGNTGEEPKESPTNFSKVLDAKELAALYPPGDNNLKIGLVSGSFDLIHLGHVRLMKNAKNFCDILVVATMSTSSLRQQEKNINGDRPIYSQDDRITVLSALRSVDHIIVFDELDCKKVIEALRPHIYFKHNKDMDRKVVIEECDIIRSFGGVVCVIDNSAGYSSTDIIKYIRRRVGSKFLQQIVPKGCD